MGSSENFCLRWNDFESNVSGAFRELREESDFFDVTLACDGASGHTLQAHKVILSACSSFFKQMLRNAAIAAPGHPNPLIYLRGVNIGDLEAVLDFMYHGEVNVAQEDLNNFLSVAEDLQVKGLTQQNSKDLGTSSKKGATRPKSSGSTGPAPKRRKQLQNDDLDNSMKDAIDVKNEPGSSGSAFVAVDSGGVETYEDEAGAAGAAAGFDNLEEGYVGYEGGATGGDNPTMIEQGNVGAVGVEGDSTKELDDLIDTLVERIDAKQWGCKQCDYTTVCSSHIRSHIETNHITGLRHICNLCGRVYKSRPSLRDHRWRKHKKGHKYEAKDADDKALPTVYPVGKN